MKTPIVYNNVENFIKDCMIEPFDNYVTFCYDDNKMEYYIIGEHINISLDDQLQIPFEIRKCDYFTIESNTINSWDNFPKIRYYINEPDISLTLNNTEKLDMSQLHIQFPKLSELRFNNFNNFDLKNINGIKINNLLYFRNINSKNIFDLSQYQDIIASGLEFSDSLYSFKNLQCVLLYKHIKRVYFNYSEIYTNSQIDILRKIMNDFLSKNNKKEYTMDMTLALLNSGFENEV